MAASRSLSQNTRSWSVRMSTCPPGHHGTSLLHVLTQPPWAHPRGPAGVCGPHRLSQEAMWGVDGPASAVLGSLLSPFPRGGDAEGLTEPPKINTTPAHGVDYLPCSLPWPLCTPHLLLCPHTGRSLLQARSPSQVCLTPKRAVRSLPLASNGSKRPPPENRCLLPQAPRVPAEGCTSFACAPSSSRARSKPNSKCLLGKHPDTHVWGPRPRGGRGKDACQPCSPSACRWVGGRRAGAPARRTERVVPRNAPTRSRQAT